MKKIHLNNKYANKINANGFTLIELLAVIIIITIISVIVVPMILNTIDKAKKGAAVSTSNNYVDALELAIVKNKLENTSAIYVETECILSEKVNISCANGRNLVLKIKGTTLDEFKVVLDGMSHILSATWRVNQYCGNYEKNKGSMITSCEAMQIEVEHIKYNPVNTDWDVENVKEALDYLFSNR